MIGHGATRCGPRFEHGKSSSCAVAKLGNGHALLQASRPDPARRTCCCSTPSALLEARTPAVCRNERPEGGGGPCSQRVGGSTATAILATTTGAAGIVEEREPPTDGRRGSTVAFALESDTLGALTPGGSQTQASIHHGPGRDVRRTAADDAGHDASELRA